ncbi:MAG: A24 family peptidase [Vicinamibacterales bacterium]
MTLFQSVAMVVATSAVVWDLSTRRIPNVLTFGAALLAFVTHGSLDGWSALGMSLGGWAVGVAFFFPLFALGGMGGGDVKLLGAIGAWLGPIPVIWVALFSGIAGGIMGLVVAGFSGYLKQAFRNVWGLLLYWRVAGVRPLPELTLSSTSRAPRLAYAVPVLAGLMVTLWWR